MGGMGMSHRDCHPLHKFPNNVMLYYRENTEKLVGEMSCDRKSI